MTVKHSILIATALIFALGAPSLEAQETGCFQIAASDFVIAAPGCYVVVNTIVPAPAVAGPIITVASSEVHLDLNRETVYGRAGWPVVFLDTVGAGGALTDVTVRNGTLEGGTNAVSNIGGGLANLTLEDLVVEGTGGWAFNLLDAQSFIMRRNTLSFAGINVGLGIVAEVSGSIDHNRLWVTDGIVVDSARGLVIADNELRGPGIALGSGGITITNSAAVRIERNSVVDASGPGSDGISVAADDSLISDNLVMNSIARGLFVSGLRNHIERNVLNLNGSYGLQIGTGSNDTVYRKNTAQGNAGNVGTCVGSTPDFCDASGGVSRTNVDNYMPDQR